MLKRETRPKNDRRDQRPRDESGSGIEEAVLKPRRVATKRVGGANMHYSVLTCAGDRHGMIGIGLAKSKEMSAAIQKSKDKARRSMIKITLTEDGSIPHEVYIKNGASIMLLKPAPLGAGIMAGGSMRQILDLAGVKNISVKILGTNNAISNAYTVMKALESLRPIVKPTAKAE
jgi:small subunit ribosomal protein S5